MKVRFEVFTAVTMKNGVFWVVTPCGSCKNPEDTILNNHESLKYCVQFDDYSVVDWIGLAQDRYRWRALVNTVMKLRVP
jgi:hypothetical protein